MLGFYAHLSWLMLGFSFDPWESHFNFHTGLPALDLETNFRADSRGELTAQISPETAEGSLMQAINLAQNAEILSQTAETVEIWDRITQNWAAAIALMQSIPPESPQRLFAQRMARYYQQQLALAQERTIALSHPLPFPDLGSEVLNQQLSHYRSYQAAVGSPDILIVGSSRALQGLDPQQLQLSLAHQGYPGIRVYNFGVNGATAQGVSLILRQVVPFVQKPKLIVWADNSRAFNSGRDDRTYHLITTSPGYRSLSGGQHFQGNTLDRSTLASTQSSTFLALKNLEAQGFLPVEEQFDPDTYYQTHARVPGQYDATYENFNLRGVQAEAFQGVMAWARSQQIPLVFINLPLSRDYLDSARWAYEQQFQAYLQQQSQQQGLIVVDWLVQWQDQNQYFADPSHLNQAGARELARQLAKQPQIPWEALK